VPLTRWKVAGLPHHHLGSDPGMSWKFLSAWPSAQRYSASFPWVYATTRCEARSTGMSIKSGPSWTRSNAGSWLVRQYTPVGSACQGSADDLDRKAATLENHQPDSSSADRSSLRCRG